MHLIVVGANYKTATVEKREKLHFASDVLPEAYRLLNSKPGIKGSIIVSTCNRVEVYSAVENIDTGFSDIISFIEEFHKVPTSELNPIIYLKSCHQAVYHLLNVAASLDSMVVGEYQIQGQIRDAFLKAQELNATNSMLNKIFQTAIQSGKKVRSDTKIGEGSLSVATLALDIIRKYFPKDHQFSLLIVGSGKMARLAAANFSSYFHDCAISITSRTNENAVSLAEQFDCSVERFEDRYDRINNFDVVVVSTTSEEYILKRDLMESSVKSNDGKTRYFVDLSIPRNIDPMIGTLSGCILYSIDDIKKVIEDNLDKRTEEVEKAAQLVNELAEEYFEWYLKQSIIPAMMEIKKGLGVIKDRTISTYSDFYNSLESSQSEAVNDMLDAYAGKIIKVIMKNIRRATTKDELLKIISTLQDTLSLDIDNEH